MVDSLPSSLTGDNTLTYNRMDLAAEPEQMLTIWTAGSGSKSAEALTFLASWVSTSDEVPVVS
jgi:hypothetical protein